MQRRLHTTDDMAATTPPKVLARHIFQYISQCEIDIPLLRTLEIGIGSRNNLTLDGWLRIPGGERLHTSTASCVTKAADTVLDD